MKYDYWSGPDEQDRRVKYAKAFTPEHQANGEDVQRRIEAVLAAYHAAGGGALPEGYASGWRPPAVNEATSNAAKRSSHLMAQAGDKRDSADGELAWWCLRNLHVLETHGLWMEHPAGTTLRAWRSAKASGRDPTPWCHLQTRPVGSPTRAYWPDAASIEEWTAFETAGGTAGMSYDAWKLLDGPGRVGRKPTAKWLEAAGDDASSLEPGQTDDGEET